MAEKQKIINIAVIAHVDAGKSTICGSIMYLTGMGNIRDVLPFPRTVGNCDL